jgi:hypothetical protein
MDTEESSPSKIEVAIILSMFAILAAGLAAPLLIARP